MNGPLGKHHNSGYIFITTVEVPANRHQFPQELGRRCALPGLAHYMSQYDHEHSSGWNKLLHGIGIPLIFAGMVLLALLSWKTGAACFVAGWMLLFLGHRIEGNKPAFFQGAIYLLVGPVWVAKELWSFLTRTHRGQSPEGLPLEKS